MRTAAVAFVAATATSVVATPAIRVSGDFSFQCGMGMIHGVVRVVDDITQVDVAAIRRELADYRAPSGGSSCCGS